MMIDIDEEAGNIKSSSFADNTKITKTLTVGDEYGEQQNDLNTIYDWAKKNKMSFNESKFVNIKYIKNSNF